jgi:hypothetical protein
VARAGIAGATTGISGKNLPENASTFHSAREQADARAIVNHSGPAGVPAKTKGHAGQKPRSAHTGQKPGSTLPAPGSLGAQSAPSSNLSSAGISSAGISGGISGGIGGGHR